MQTLRPKKSPVKNSSDPKNTQILVAILGATISGSVLYSAGIHQIDTVDQAAQALEPLTGKFAYFIFAIGVMGTGLLAIPALAGAQSYMLAETFGWKTGLDKKFTKAKEFYISIILSLLVGLALEFLDVSPVKSLLYTAILYGLIAPVLILPCQTEDKTSELLKSIKFRTDI